MTVGTVEEKTVYIELSGELVCALNRARYQAHTQGHERVDVDNLSFGILGTGRINAISAEDKLPYSIDANNVLAAAILAPVNEGRRIVEVWDLFDSIEDYNRRRSGEGSRISGTNGVRV